MDEITIKNGVSGDSYKVTALVLEERESNETVVLHGGDLTADEWTVE